MHPGELEQPTGQRGAGDGADGGQEENRKGGTVAESALDEPPDDDDGDERKEQTGKRGRDEPGRGDAAEMRDDQGESCRNGHRGRAQRPGSTQASRSECESHGRFSSSALCQSE